MAHFLPLKGSIANDANTLPITKVRISYKKNQNRFHFPRPLSLSLSLSQRLALPPPFRYSILAFNAGENSIWVLPENSL